jgi:four helix bundle protein
MRDFKQARVWHLAHSLTLCIYRASASFPDDERFGLTAHLRKTALSVPSNIAEGCGRKSTRDLARFLSIAAGSASELDYQLLLAFDLGYLSQESFQPISKQVTRLRRMLYRFIDRLNPDTSRPVVPRPE